MLWGSLSSWRGLEEARYHRGLIVLAFGIVYVVWGSTYLAIRLAIDSLPPFLMAGCRFLVAGSILYLVGYSCGAAAPTRQQWLSGAVAGSLLIFLGNGGVVWAEQAISTGLAALLGATVPIWMVFLEWLGPERKRPTRRIAGGVLLGLVGMIGLIGPELISLEGSSLAGILAILVSCLAFTIGSLYLKYADLPRSLSMSTAVQLLTGGVMLLLVSVLDGEMSRFDASAVTWASLLAVLYLIVFGSLIAYTAFAWLMRVADPTLVSTYAYVNPVVAVLLGAMVLHEPLTLSTLVAGGAILASVALLLQGGPAPASRPWHNNETAGTAPQPRQDSDGSSDAAQRAAADYSDAWSTSDSAAPSETDSDSDSDSESDSNTDSLPPRPRLCSAESA